MTSHSAGQRPDHKRFLTAYATGVEGMIRDLQDARIPKEGDYALRGEERRDIKGMAEAGIIRV